jgi:hypothetical protein
VSSADDVRWLARTGHFNNGGLSLDPVDLSWVSLTDRRTGRSTRVLHRGMRYLRHKPFRGRRITAAFASNTRLVWVEQTLRSGRQRSSVAWQSPLPFGTSKPQRVASDASAVAIANDGTIAAKIGSPHRLVLFAPGRRPRTVARSVGWRIGVDDGSMLWWFDKNGMRFRDLQPPRTGTDGCPLRSRYRALAAAGSVVASRAEYESSAVLRICDPRTGREGFVPTEVGSTLEALSDQALLTVKYRVDRYRVPACYLATITTYRLWSWAPLRQASRDTCDNRGFVVTDGGRAAWTEGPDRTGVKTLFAMSPAGDGPVLTLDTGDVGDLRADGERFTWTKDGLAKSES